MPQSIFFKTGKHLAPIMKLHAYLKKYTNGHENQLISEKMMHMCLLVIKYVIIHELN